MKKTRFLAIFSIMILSLLLSLISCTGGEENKNEGDLPEVEHTHEAVTVYGKAASCTESGLTDGEKCSSCGEILTEQSVIPPTGHIESDWIMRLEASCVSEGEEYRECTVCQTLLDFKTITALGHSERTLPSVAPTCTESGLTEGKECAICGETLIQAEVVPALNHTPGDWIIDKPATYESNGEKHRECTVCHDTVETSFIPMLHHSYTSVVTLPTCTEQGYTTHICSECGDVYIDEYNPPLGHTLGAWQITKENNCTKDGEKIQKCTVCSETVKTEIIPQKGHNEIILSAKEPTCTSAGLTEGKQCLSCGEITKDQSVIPPLDHSLTHYGAKDPTCTEIGWNAYDDCSACGYNTYEEKSATGHLGTDICTVCGEIIYTYISTAEQLKNMKLDGNYALSCDIDLGGIEWTPIGKDGVNYFTGIFDGKGYTISNFKITESKEYIGFFGYFDGSVKNLNIENFYYTPVKSSSTTIGGVVAMNYNGTVDNCTVSGVISVPSYNGGTYATEYIGGVVGYNYLGTTSNCTANVNISASFTSTTYSSSNIAYVGCVSGANLGTVDNCKGYGEISVTTVAKLICVGGVLGVNSGNLLDSSAFSTLYAEGENGEINIGGVVGKNTSVLERCYSISTVSAKAQVSLVRIGGLAGHLYNSGAVDCYSAGSVSINTYAAMDIGGLVGYAYSYNKEIKNCYSTADIIVENDVADVRAGGLVGYTNGTAIINCYATGNISVKTQGYAQYVSGLIGKNGGTLSGGYFSNSQSISLVVKGVDSPSKIKVYGTKTDITALTSPDFLKNTLGFSAEIWTIKDGQHPTLK